MQGSYGNGKTEFQDFSRTIPGFFSFFKDSISSQFCIKQRENAVFFSLKTSKWKYTKGALVFFDSDSSDKKTHKLNRIEYKSHLTLQHVSSDFHSFFYDFQTVFFLHIL